MMSNKKLIPNPKDFKKKNYYFKTCQRRHSMIFIYDGSERRSSYGLSYEATVNLQ